LSWRVWVSMMRLVVGAVSRAHSVGRRLRRPLENFALPEVTNEESELAIMVFANATAVRMFRAAGEHPSHAHQVNPALVRIDHASVCPLPGDQPRQLGRAANRRSSSVSQNTSWASSHVTPALSATGIRNCTSIISSPRRGCPEAPGGCRCYPTLHRTAAPCSTSNERELLVDPTVS